MMPREKTAMKKVKWVEIWNSFWLLELRRLRMASSVVLRSRKARSLFETKLVTLSNEGISWFAVLHAIPFENLFDIALL
ncbi:Unknown protein [Striga hermonthica]|uniref:Uncharacterized protein n=1 Tax=Striga hermonthica TaxID=68872 RepID=A0A9N7N8G6_STRHE|nr:Unknown protein [Striga hermonthica]